MATAYTITGTTRYLDTLTTATGQANITINKSGTTPGKLIIRTDTRFNNTNSTGLGCIGTITANANATVKITGKNVRWLAFENGSGVVPSFGATVSQGGVSGVSIGVYSAVNSAPLSVGAAMPSSGFIKFREVTGGTFSAGALSGISANASSADVTGWIEIAGVKGSVWTTKTNTDEPSLLIDGDWFYLGLTSGAANQTFITPSMGQQYGVCAAIQVETAPSSGTYEWYDVMNATMFKPGVIGTDSRSKCAFQGSNGVVIVGGNGTDAIGYVPPAGCRVRIPNVIFVSVAAETSAGTTNDYRLGAACVLNSSSTKLADITINCADAKAVGTNPASPNIFTVKNSCTALMGTVYANIVKYENSIHTVQRVDTDTSDYSGVNARFSIYCSTSNGVSLYGSTFTTSCGSFFNMASTSYCTFCMYNVTDSTIENVKFVKYDYASSSTYFGIIWAQQFYNVKFKNVTAIRMKIIFNVSASGINHDNVKFIPSVWASNSSSIGGTAFEDFPLTGTLTNTYAPGDYGLCQTYTAAVYNTGTTFVDAGTRSNPVTFSGSINPTSLVYSQYFNDIVARRIFMKGSSSSVNKMTFSGTTGTSTSGVKFINCMAHPAAGILANICPQQDVIYMGCYYDHPTTAGLTNSSGAASGSHWGDFYGVTDNTTGRLVFSANASTVKSTYLSTSFTTSYAGFTSGASYYGWLLSSGDKLYFDMPYFLLAHSSFANTAVVIDYSEGTGIDVFYQIDIGAGYNGVWKSLTLANLLTETLNPAGSRMKFYAVGKGTSSNPSIFRGISIGTTTSATLQDTYKYPDDSYAFALTGLQPGSEVRCFVGTDEATSVEISGTESSGTSFSFSHSYGGQVGYIQVISLGYKDVFISNFKYPTADYSLPVQQELDRNYSNPV